MTTSRTRQPDETREKLLEAAFEEIHLNGFQSAGLESILSTAGVTRGALYHHFGSKAELGLVALDEVIDAIMMEDWVEPVAEPSGDPVTALRETLWAEDDPSKAET